MAGPQPCAAVLADAPGLMANSPPLAQMAQAADSRPRYNPNLCGHVPESFV